MGTGVSHKMAAKCVLVSERLGLNFATARALARGIRPSSRRSFQRITAFGACTRHYSSPSGQRRFAAMHSSVRRPPEAALGVKAYSSTSKDQDGGGRTSSREKTRVESSDAPEEQRGSVIMQFVESKESPKELTTARKGMCAG